MKYIFKILRGNYLQSRTLYAVKVTKCEGRIKAFSKVQKMKNFTCYAKALKATGEFVPLIQERELIGRRYIIQETKDII